MKTILLSLLLATPAFAQDPASRPVTKVFGVYVDGNQHDLIVIPIVLLVFGIPAIVGIVALAMAHRRKRDREETLRLALQTQNVPPELLAAITSDREKPQEETRSLPQAVFLGCILAGVGSIPALDKYGIMLFFMFMGAGFILRAYFTQHPPK